MIPGASANHGIVVGIPRESGDDPIGKAGGNQLKRYSPRERG